MVFISKMATAASEITENSANFVENDAAPVSEINRGRRSRRSTTPNKRARAKARRYSYDFSLKWERKCSHPRNPKAYKCHKLTEGDVLNFRRRLFQSSNKVEQDQFILLHIELHLVKRRTLSATAIPKRPRASSNKFKISTDHGNIFVCRDTFHNIIQPIGRTRVDGIISRFRKHGTTPHENRGGDRKSQKSISKKNSVRNFIKNLKGTESHYGAAKSVRVYLPIEMRSIAHLWRKYNASVVDMSLKVSKVMFYRIFVNEFNIGFGSPRVDTCTFCDRTKSIIRKCDDPQEKQDMITQLRIHQLRAKSFYEIVRSEQDNSVKIVFDLQKVHNLPKLTIQEAYYSRKLSFYNLGVCMEEHKFAYVWNETQSGRGSNQISSCLHNFLTTELPKLERYEELDTVYLVCDGCGGQNKNNILLSMAISWLYNAPKHIKFLQLLFPVRGHSYLPCDRLFGRIQQELKSHEMIFSPDEYVAVFKNHCESVKLFGTDYAMRDWKALSSEYYKPLAGIQNSKRIFLVRSRNKNNKTIVTVQSEENYKVALNNTVTLLKARKSYPTTLPRCLPRRLPISVAKKKDIENLLTAALGDEWRNDDRVSVYLDLTSDLRVEDNDEPLDGCECCGEDSGVRI